MAQKVGVAFPASMVRSLPSALGLPLVSVVLIWAALAYENTPVTRIFGSIGVVFEVAALGIFFALHRLVGWDIEMEFVSDYARDPKWGRLMDWSFAFMGLGAVSLGFGVRARFGPDSF